MKRKPTAIQCWPQGRTVKRATSVFYTLVFLPGGRTKTPLSGWNTQQPLSSSFTLLHLQRSLKTARFSTSLTKTRFYGPQSFLCRPCLSQVSCYYIFFSRHSLCHISYLWESNQCCGAGNLFGDSGSESTH